MFIRQLELVNKIMTKSLHIILNFINFDPNNNYIWPLPVIGTGSAPDYCKLHYNMAGGVVVTPLHSYCSSSHTISDIVSAIPLDVLPFKFTSSLGMDNDVIILKSEA